MNPDDTTFYSGATETQKRDAIRRHCAFIWSLAGEPPPSDTRIAAWLDRSARERPSSPVDYWAAMLVPPGYRIVRDDTLIAPNMEPPREENDAREIPDG